MLKYVASILFLLLSAGLFAQNSSNPFEKYPVFSECESVEINALESCFNNTLQSFLFSNFRVPEIVTTESYQGQMNVFFEVNKEGDFKLLYVDAIYNELKEEAKRVFSSLPKITPATYNGNPSYVQFTVPINIPLVKPEPQTAQAVISNTAVGSSMEVQSKESLSLEYDNIVKVPYENDKYTSSINIPLSHTQYSRFDADLNQIGLNNHTAQKPYIYKEVNKYYNFESNLQPLLKPRSTWLGRKFWNEHMVTLKGKDFWLTLDPGVDLQAGKGH